MTPKTYNQNHPIALFNRPNRSGALHKKLDLMFVYVRRLAISVTSFVGLGNVRLFEVSVQLGKAHRLFKSYPQFFLDLGLLF
jgi:hypothetical protein